MKFDRVKRNIILLILLAVCLLVSFFLHRCEPGQPSRPSAVGPAVPIGMIVVAGGVFEMGSEQGDIDEIPVHPVSIPDFAIGQYEVTMTEYRQCVDDGGCDYPRVGAECNFNKEGRETHPMNCVNWFEAVTYANWLSRKQGLPECYNLSRWDFAPDCKGYRLPTEAEWEYAARGGKMSQGVNYSGSNNADEVAWYKITAGDRTRPVGQKKPNELGLYDMSGNVAEWIQDWYDPNYYKESPAGSPHGPSQGTFRGMRGGGWFSKLSLCRSSGRYKLEPERFYDALGFRLVISR
jgi:formylglycine-generating enzyme required for sulfatase activity